MGPTCAMGGQKLIWPFLAVSDYIYIYVYGLPPVHIMCILRWGWCAHSTTTSFKLLLLGTKEISFSYICSNHGRGALAPWAEPTPRVLTSPAKRGARPQFFMRWQDCMAHGKTMSSLKLGTLGARHPPQSPQLATKESTMEEHKPKEKWHSPWRQGAAF